jgi:hypothetical protein
MVKVFIAIFIFAIGLYAQSDKEKIEQKVQTILDEKSYKVNKGFIDIIFSPPSEFIINDRVNSVKVVQVLKENGLLKLFFNKPTEIELKFKTNANPLFFVKVMDDTLRRIGYYRYVTKSSSYSNSEFTWSVSIVSEYATDPEILQKELSKKGCDIVDIQRETPTKWIYTIDMGHAYLNVTKLQNGIEVKLRRSLFAYWLDVSKIRKLRILSKGRNNWYPRIVYFDSNLHLIRVINRDKKSYDITLAIPKNAKYIKISDIYTMKNIKDSLILKPSGSR